MLNYIWVSLMLAAVMIGMVQHTLPAVVTAITQSASTAVTIALGLIGVMSLWLGLMKIAEASGVLRGLNTLLRPILKRLFPSIGIQHPAMDAISLSLSANMLGLGNAATPFGLKAMQQLELLNRHPGVASDAMCMLLALHTSSIQLIPITSITLLSLAGESNAASIIFPTLIATFCSTGAAIISSKFLSKRRLYRIPHD